MRRRSDCTARHRSLSGLFGAFWSGFDIILAPRSTGDGGFIRAARMWLFHVPCFLFIYFFMSKLPSPPNEERIRSVLSLFLAHYLPHQSGVHLDRVRTGVHFCREWAIICPGVNRPIPSKLTVGIPGFTFIPSMYLTRIRAMSTVSIVTVIYNVWH